MERTFIKIEDRKELTQVLEALAEREPNLRWRSGQKPNGWKPFEESLVITTNVDGDSPNQLTFHEPNDGDPFPYLPKIVLTAQEYLNGETHETIVEGTIETMFKVGDRVIVNSFLKAGEERDQGCNVTHEMEALAGKAGVIRRADPECGGRYKLDISGCWFGDSMLTKEGEEEIYTQPEKESGEKKRDIPELEDMLDEAIERLAVLRKRASEDFGKSTEYVDQYIADHAPRKFEKIEKMSNGELMLFMLGKVVGHMKDRGGVLDE